MSLSGGFCSVSCSLLLPSLCFLLLHRRGLALWQAAATLGLLALGVALLLLITAENLLDIVSKSHDLQSDSLTVALAAFAR